MAHTKKASFDLNLSNPHEEGHATSHNSFGSLAKDREFSATILPRINRVPSDYIRDPLRENYMEIKSAIYQKVLPKRGEGVLQEVGSHENISDNGYNHNYQEWRKLTLVAKSIKRFRTLTVERIGSEYKLRNSMNSHSPSKRKENSSGIMYITHGQVTGDALTGFKEQTQLFDALERGNNEDLRVIRKMLAEDPKKHMYEADSQNIRINKPNTKGYTPLYVACKNGNLELLKLLLSMNANPMQIINIQPKGVDTILEVAARWGHLNIVRHLTSIGLVWPPKTLKRALDDAGNEEMRNILRTEINKEKKPFLKRLFSRKTSEVK